MKQGLLAFQYEEEKSTTGMTALSGLMTYVELMHVAGLRSSVERRVGLRGGGQGWTDSHIITSLILLNLAGGESVMDLEVLEKDAGLCRVLRHAETHGMRRRERRALKARWRGERWRSVPSDSVVFRYLERFHDAGEEAKREAHRAFIPSPNDALKGLGKVNALGVGQSTVERIRKRCVEEGVESALNRKKQLRRRQKRLDGEGEARLIAMACGEPPEGRASWTLKLLADQLVECEIVGTISTETVRQALKKNELKPWLKQSWCLPPGQSAEFVCAMEDVLEV